MGAIFYFYNSVREMLIKCTSSIAGIGGLGDAHPTGLYLTIQKVKVFVINKTIWLFPSIELGDTS